MRISLRKISSLNLQTKIIVTVLLLSLASIWTLTFLISKRLEHNMSDQIAKQQFTIASFLANNIDNQVKAYINSLNTIAALITPDLIANPRRLKEFLRNNPLLSSLFQTGVMVISKDGKGLADYPSLPERSSASYSEMEYFQEVVATKKPAVGKPRIGRFSHKPVIVFAVPVFSPSGEFSAVLAGIVPLSDPVLLGVFRSPIYKDFPDSLLLSSPKYRIHIIGSDETRNMTPTPKTGRNPLFDRFMTGYEGSGSTVNIRGVQIFLSAKQIPSAGWFLRVGMPTDMAFAPIHKMYGLVYSLAVGLSFISCLIVWFVVRQALRPLYAAIEQIPDVTEGRRSLLSIPLMQHDEIGQLITSFNSHLIFRKQAEEGLQNANSYNRSLLEASLDPLVTIGQNGMITDVNQASEAAIGYSREELIGTDFAACFTDPGKAQEGYRQVFKTGQVRDYPLEIRHRKGRIIPVMYNATLYHDDSGKVVGVFAAARDISASKRAEEEKRSIEERLSRMEKMEAIGTLAGGVAHDLNNMLGVLIGNAEIIKLDLEKTDPLYNRVEGIMTSGQQAAMLVQDLLTMARRGVVLREPASLNKILEDQIKSSEVRNLLSSYPDANIETQYDRDLLDINASAIHIERVITNLIANALRAMGGRGALTIRTENRYLEGTLMGYEAVPKGEYAVLSVSDTGMGIPPEHMRNLFDPFYMRKVLKRGGTGLGLSVIWGAMKDHDGYIDVTSELGQGTTFSLYFPVTRDNTVKWEERSVEEYRGYGETILVVDDDEDQCRLAAMMLTRLNYVVKTVESGEEALEYLADHDVDLIVLDMIMEPGMDGYDTYRSILEIKKRQKAIIFSGFTKTERVKMAQELGAGEFIMKPYVMERIGIAVRKELDKK